MLSNFKGIVLAGGSGTRLHPVTLAVSKQLLPVYDKPLIYYPISVLMLAGIREILLITTPHDIEAYKRLLGDGASFGISIEYAIQPSPDGIAQAFLLGESFIGSSSVALILGDNLFFGHGFTQKLVNASSFDDGATIFGYKVKDPERFGIAEIDSNGVVQSIIEKPSKAKSDYAVTGLYFYDNDVIKIAKGLKPSHRNELEITDVNNFYLREKKLRIELLGRGFAWIDTGTHSSLLEAGQFVKTLEESQNFKIACLEEIGLVNGWITKSDLASRYSQPNHSSYHKYIMKLLNI